MITKICNQSFESSRVLKNIHLVFVIAPVLCATCSPFLLID